MEPTLGSVCVCFLEHVHASVYIHCMSLYAHTILRWWKILAYHKNIVLIAFSFSPSSFPKLLKLFNTFRDFAATAIPELV